MARKGLMPISSARGAYISLEPLVNDPTSWLRDEFDWQSEIAVVDMFSGAGGMSFGLDSVDGMTVVAAFERDPIASETHRANMAGAVHTADVSRIDDFKKLLRGLGVRRVDVLAGGPPCQGFSRLGKGALRKMALSDGRRVDVKDPRNWMFRHFMRAVRQLKPQLVLIENVPEMLNYEPVIEEIEAVFEELDYAFDRQVLRADDHGVPQQRKRLFMVANSHGDEVDWPNARPTCPTLYGAIGDLPAIPAGHMEEETPRPRPDWTSSYITEMRRGLVGKDTRIIRDHVTRVHRPEDIKAFQHMSEGDRYASIPRRLRRYRDDIFSDKYHRMEWEEPAWTVTAHLAKDGYKYIHPEQNRTLSVREAARIQSFPDSFRFAGHRTHRYIQVGNAVPPRLATALGDFLLPIIR